MERDVPNYQDKPHEPTNPQNWYKSYKKLVKESEKEIGKDAALLKATIDGINNEKAKHKLKRVDLDFVELPGSVKRDAQIIRLPNKIRFIDRGAQHNRAPSQRQIKINRGELNPNAPRRVIEPKGKLDQFRRQAKAMGHFQHQSPKRPTGIITAREMALKQKPTATTIVKAPRVLIEEHRAALAPRPIDLTARTMPLIAQGKRKIEHDIDERPGISTTEEREERLKVFTDPGSTSNAVPTIRPARSQTSTPTASSPAPKPPLDAPKPPVEAGSAFGQIGNRNIEVVRIQKAQDAVNRKLRSDEERIFGLTRLGAKGGSPLSTGKEAASATQQPQILPCMISPSKAISRQIPAPDAQISRTSTIDQSKDKVATPPIMKKKRAVDVFMPPHKRPRRS